MVAVTRPLTLKAEVFRKSSASATYSGIAQVWVDSGIYHLDQEFEYLIPEELDSLIDIGVRVIVPFSHRECEAIVLSRGPLVGLSQSAHTGLKAISKVVTPFPVATRESLNLIAQVCKRWAAHPYDVIRSAIPPRSAQVDKEEFEVDQVDPVSRKVNRRYIQFPPSQDHLQLIAKYLAGASKDGSMLVLCPDSKAALRLHALVGTSILLDSALDKTTRYRNFLRTLRGSKLIIIGTRSAIFSPVRDLSEIIIVNEASEHFYEARTPGWNVRDVAILRSDQSSVALTFTGFSPSPEAALLIEESKLSFQPVKAKVAVQSLQSSPGELLPDGAFSFIRSALRKGPVLFLSPQRGFAQAVICSKCRNISRCECGGKHVLRSSSKPFECALCQKKFPHWECVWCHSKEPILLGRGSERIAHEVGRAFPGFAICESNGDKPLEKYESDSGIVVATPGAVPVANNGFSAVIALQCESLFSQADIRSQERAREILFGAAGHLSRGGLFLLVISHNHPIIAALASWKPAIMTRRELRDRLEVGFPPYSRAVSLEIEVSEMQSLLRGLKSAQSAGRLPASTRFLGPAAISSVKSRIILLVPVEDGQNLISLLHEFLRRRSATKKTLASMRIDPYSLT